MTVGRVLVTTGAADATAAGATREVDAGERLVAREEAAGAVARDAVGAGFAACAGWLIDTSPAPASTANANVVNRIRLSGRCVAMATSVRAPSGA